MLFFFLIEFCKPCVIHGLVRNFSSFLLSFLKGPWVSNKLSTFDRYLLIEKLTSFPSLHKMCSQFIWLKSKINLLLSNFFQSSLRIIDLMWHYLIQFPLKKVEFEKILSIKVDLLEILVGKTIRGNKKLELTIKLFTESEISYFN